MLEPLLTRFAIVAMISLIINSTVCESVEQALATAEKFNYCKDRRPKASDTVLNRDCAVVSLSLSYFSKMTTLLAPWKSEVVRAMA
jgi:hypothetical protein